MCTALRLYGSRGSHHILPIVSILPQTRWRTSLGIYPGPITSYEGLQRRSLKVLTRFGGSSRGPNPQSSSSAALKDDAAVRPSWRGLWFKLLKLLGSLAITSALLLAALPTLLSTPKGTQLGCAIASRSLPGTVHVQKAELGWQRKVKLFGVSFQSPSTLGRETLASAAAISSSESLWQVLRGRAFDCFAEKAYVDNSLSPSGKFKWAQILDYEAGKVAGPTSLQVASLQPDLVKDTEEIAFTAEGRFLSASFYTGGLIKIPKEVKEVIGQDLHLAAVIGKANLLDSQEELGLDTDWVTDSPEGTSQPEQPGMASRHRGAAEKVGTEEQSAVSGQQADQKWPKGGEPTIVSVRSQHMDIEASGWRLPDGTLKLRRPASATLDFTPALAEYGLSRLSPLLSGVLAVDEGKVSLTLTPEGFSLPAKSYKLRMEPLRLAVKRQDLLAKAIEFMRLKESKEIAHKSLLQGATSAIHVDIDKNGAIDTQRVDLLVSSDSTNKGVHLCTWGSVDPMTAALDISLGIPSSALALLGLKCGKDSDMLVIPVAGKTSSIRVNWSEAYKRLASLAAKQPGKTDSLRGKILHGVVQALDVRANAPGLAPEWHIPDPPEPLPWAGSDPVLRGMVNVDADTVKLPESGQHGA